MPSLLPRSALVLLSVVWLWPGSAPVQKPAGSNSPAEVRALFAEYLRLHAAKDMTAWAELFLPEANCVRTGFDGRIEIYTNMKDFAAGIAEGAKALKEQHETFDQVNVDVNGDAGSYATTYSLYHDGKKIQQGRAYFNVVRKDGRWRIASLVWYKQDWKP